MTAGEFRERRKAKRWSQEEMARQLGVSRATVARAEAAKGEVDRTLALAAKYLTDDKRKAAV